MALQDTDLLVVGRGVTSYHYSYDNFKTHLNAGLATEGYVDNLVGLSTAGLASIIYVDNLVGLSTAGISTEGLASEGYVDNLVGLSTAGLASIIYVDNLVGLSTAGLALNADLQAEINNRIAADAGITSSLQAEINNRIAADAGITSSLQAEIANRTAADAGITSSLQAEITRATQAETALGTRIDTLILDDLADVTVGGATTGQAVTWNGTNWIAETVTAESPLTFIGSIDLTDYSTAPVITASDAGDIYINTGIGTVDVGFGSSVTNSITDATSGELIAVNAVGAWQYFGTVGASGLSYDDFSAATITETPGSKGELAYNNVTGQYTFTMVDLDSRVPQDLSTLPTLP